MRKMSNWWKNWWESLWKNCELVVNKLVDKWKINRISAFGLWNTRLDGGIKRIFSGIVIVISGKTKQINKLYISEVSTIST